MNKREHTPTGPFTLDTQQARNHGIDNKLVKAIAAIIPAGSSIIDIGAAKGDYVRAFRKVGYKTHGIDGTKGIFELTGGLVEEQDLTKDCSALRARCDWGLFLEVGEHIPRQYEDAVIDRVCKIPMVGLIVSWCPFSGPGHVNCQRPPYVANAFGLRRWRLDTQDTYEIRSKIRRPLSGRLMVFRR